MAPSQNGKNKRMNLHNHSSFSYQDGYGTPEQILKRVLELKQSAFAITDHGNVSAWTPMFKKFHGSGVKILFGIEAYIVEDRTEKGISKATVAEKLARAQRDSKRLFNVTPSGKKEQKPHITLIAMSKQGMNNISALVSESYKTGWYDTRPRIDIDLLIKYSEDVLVTTGCPTGFPTRLITRGEDDKARKFIEILSKNIKNLVVEIVAQPGYYPSELAAPKLYEMAKDFNLKTVITGDSHFPYPEDYEAQHMLARIGFNNPVWEESKNGAQEYQFISSREQLLVRANTMLSCHESDHNEALDNALEICDSIPQLELQTGQPPKYFATTESPETLLWRESGLGLKKRFDEEYITDRTKIAEYKARLKYELDIVISKGFSSYFLIMRDIALSQKKKGRIVICRGSGGGCLLAYALGISETDPIYHDLMFERFMSPERDDYPDLDLDFSPEGRADAFIEISKLGYYAYRIEAISEFSLKSAILATARMTGTNRDSLEYALGSITDAEDFESKEITQMFIDHPELTVARELDGQAYTSSVHAAGIIITNKPIELPIYYKEDKLIEERIPVLSLTKKTAELAKFIKADTLSVRSIGGVEKILEKIGKTPEFLYKLPLDDPKVFKECEEYPAAIFQLDGHISKIFRDIDGENFQDLAAASALARPGAFNFVRKYAERRKDYTTEVGKILSETNLVALYQEGIYKICRLANLSWADTNAMRKAISSSSTAKKESIDAVKKYLGLIKENLGDQITDELLANIEKHGMYSFNKSHCTTYALLCYYMAWLKTYYPCEFVEVICNMEMTGSNTNWVLVRRLVFELVKKGVVKKIEPLVLDQRQPFVIKDGVLYGSFLSIFGAGEKAGLSIVDALQTISHKAITPAKLAKIRIIAKAFKNQETQQNLSLHWVPWLPVKDCEHFKKCKLANKNWALTHGYDGFENLAKEPIYSPRTLPLGGNLTVAGYVTAIRRKSKTLAMPYSMLTILLECPNGQIEMQVSSKYEVAYDECLKNIHRGDFAGFTGSFDGRIFRAYEACILHKEEIEHKDNTIGESENEHN